jgi:hypothetical protein
LIFSREQRIGRHAVHLDFRVAGQDPTETPRVIAESSTTRTRIMVTAYAILW